jgi:hypothetical protein
MNPRSILKLSWLEMHGENRRAALSPSCAFTQEQPAVISLPC